MAFFYHVRHTADRKVTLALANSKEHILVTIWNERDDTIRVLDDWDGSGSSVDFAAARAIAAVELDCIVHNYNLHAAGHDEASPGLEGREAKGGTPREDRGDRQRQRQILE